MNFIINIYSLRVLSKMTNLKSVIDYLNDENNFNDKSHIEFEIKLLIDPRTKNAKFYNKQDLESCIEECKLLFKYFELTYKTPSNKQTINFINNKTTTSVIKTLHFTNAIQDKEKKTTFIKNKLQEPVYIHSTHYDFKLTICSELLSEEESDYNLIRFKQRFTFVIKNWNIDFTFVKTSLSKDINLIKEIKDKLFIGTTSDNIFTTNSFIWEYSDSIEIEFECTALDNLTVADITEITNKIDRFKSLDKIDMPFITRLNFIMNAEKLANTIKKILPNAIEINKKQYFEEILPNISKFYLTDKADGIRCLLIIDDNISYYDSDLKVLEKNNLFNVTETIVECELINGIFYAYDIIKYDGVEIIDKTLEHRLKILYMLDNIWSSLLIKEFVRLTDDYSDQINDFYKRSLRQKYNVDGLIFTSANQPYKLTRFYKWKHNRNMTIDFVAKKCPNKLLGVVPYIIKQGQELYILFSGINLTTYKKFNIKKIQYYKILFPSTQSDYFPIQFSPSDMPYAYLFWHTASECLDSKIVELSYFNSWHLEKIREDRSKEFEAKNYFGNNFKVAELIWRNYSNPLNVELLISTIKDLGKDFYFKTHNSDDHKIVRKFNNMVKMEILTRLTNNYTSEVWVIDLGCGKGQDLNKYIKLKTIKNTLFIDNNDNNLCSLIERKYTYAKDKTREGSVMGIYVKNLDLNKDYNLNLGLIKTSHPLIQKLQTKLIVCNFAIHYFVKDLTQLDNFINLVDSMLPSGGRFIFTCLNGELIHTHLTKDPKVSSWGDGSRYLINKLFKTKKFIGGEQIELILPFSDGILYKESLVNLNQVERRFKKKKIILESQANFGEIYLDKFKETDEINFNKLDQIDLEYIKLVYFSIYYKK